MGMREILELGLEFEVEDVLEDGGGDGDADCRAGAAESVGCGCDYGLVDVVDGGDEGEEGDG